MKRGMALTTEYPLVKRLVRGGWLLGAMLGALAAMWLMMAWLETALLVSTPRASANGGVSGTFTDTTVADFTTGATLTDTSVANANGGELRLRATIEDYFNPGAINTAVWVSGTNVGGVVPVITGTGELELDGGWLRSQVAFSGSLGSGRFFEARARFRENSGVSAPEPVVGYAQETEPGAATDSTQSRIFAVEANTLVIAARDGTPPRTASAVVTPDLTQFHTYLIEWIPNETLFYVDDTFTGTINLTQALTSWVWLDAFQNTGNGFSRAYVDWVRAGQYAASGSYVSRVRDVGGVVNWTTLTAATSVPQDTTVVFETRTSLDNATWSSWSATSGVNITSPSGRYFQYRILMNVEPNRQGVSSPEVSQVIVNYLGPSTVQVNPVTLDPGATHQFTATTRDANNNPVSGLIYGWQVMNGGGAINSSGLFTAQLPAGTFTNTISATVQTTGGPIFGTASVTVRDLPPNANANGPYAGNEGAVITLTASGTDPNGTAVAFAWDLDDNGLFETSGATPGATFPDNGTYPIRLRATDTTGLTATTTTTVTVSNVAPTLVQVANSGPGQPNEPITITVTATDPAGVNDPLQYHFDCDNNGTYEISQAGNTATCTFAGTGSFTVPVRVTDGDGGAVTGSTVVVIGPKVYLPLILR